MIKQNSAQIYLAASRGKQQTEAYNCWSTFNFDNYQEESRKAFGSLFLFNHYILAPKQSLSIVAQKNSLHYILPLFGGIEFKDQKQNNNLLVTEQFQQVVCQEETNFEISNPFDKNVSFLQMAFVTKTDAYTTAFLGFNFKEKNKLIPLFENNTASAFIAQFDGRNEAHYQLKNKENGIFTFIIIGAFEFENRLLEVGDALSLKEIEAVEWEALSENAMLLIIETSLA
ncbi:pirin family protein [Flavobacterium flavipallidum]|uniref:Quercetin 2,3-dioxygenase C-terminal cupin domain-containing protein n=1 Tax=Flavobacterium flavipallidum TaxID=3139140 RepID=A0ABU9HIZ5_9FLAO